jgi:hypothetical protein
LYLLFVTWTAYSLVSGFLNPNIDIGTIDNVGHLTGLIFGFFVGLILTREIMKQPTRQILLMSGITVALLITVIVDRQANLYCLYLDNAQREFEAKNISEATRLLHKALDMKPKSRFARRLAFEIKNEERKNVTSTQTSDTCAALQYYQQKTDFQSLMSIGVIKPCADKICDNRVHVYELPDGGRFYYFGNTATSTPQLIDGKMQATTTETVMSISLDEFNEISCTQQSDSQYDNDIDINGKIIGKSRIHNSSKTTNSVSDSLAQQLRGYALELKEKESRVH